jgi:DamX protein
LSRSEQNNKKEALKVEAKQILSTKKEAASFKAKNVVVESKAAVKKKVVQPVLKKEIKKPVVEAVKKELTVSQSNKQWIISRNNNNFTLQLLGVSTEESASKFIAEHKEIKALYFFQNKRNDGKWFSVIYGDFKNKEAAMKKAKKMPSSLSKIKPWVRQFDAVKKDLFVKN